MKREDQYLSVHLNTNTWNMIVEYLKPHHWSHFKSLRCVNFYFTTHMHSWNTEKIYIIWEQNKTLTLKCTWIQTQTVDHFMWSASSKLFFWGVFWAEKWSQKWRRNTIFDYLILCNDPICWGFGIKAVNYVHRTTQTSWHSKSVDLSGIYSNITFPFFCLALVMLSMPFPFVNFHFISQVEISFDPWSEKNAEDWCCLWIKLILNKSFMQKIHTRSEPSAGKI